MTPDLAILNASVHTLDKAQPDAQAVAIQANRIVALDRLPKSAR